MEVKVRYIPGHGWRHTLHFTNRDTHEPIDPTGIQVEIKSFPAKTIIQTIIQSELEREEVGVWSFDYVPAAAGKYLYEVTSTDAVGWAFQYMHEVSAGY